MANRTTRSAGNSKVFMGWSGDRSNAMATQLAAWLPRVVQSVRPWISEKSLQPGERWSEVIGRELSTCHTGIVCVTPENLRSQWLHFEAGALSKVIGESRVYPVLLGMSTASLHGPLSQFQAVTMDRPGLHRLVTSLNAQFGADAADPEVVDASFEKFWPDIAANIHRVSLSPLDSASMEDVIEALQGSGFASPMDGRIACFHDGFESHRLYDIAFKISRKRLYVFGRKNRKVFDKEHVDFFRHLPDRLDAGLDFRCLFLDPEAPDHILHEAHQDAEFRGELGRCIHSAFGQTAASGVDINRICRTYTAHRHAALVVIDDSVLFTPIRMDPAGRALPLTRVGFEVVDASIQAGRTLIEYFLQTWEGGRPLARVSQASAKDP